MVTETYLLATPAPVLSYSRQVPTRRLRRLAHAAHGVGMSTLHVHPHILTPTAALANADQR